MLESANEELAGKGDVYAHVAMHGMLAQHVDAEFLTSLSEAPKRVQRKNIGEDATTLIPMDQVQELFGHRLTWIIVEVAPLCASVEVVHASVLVVKRFRQDHSLESRASEHTLDPALELYEAVIEWRWSRS